MSRANKLIACLIMMLSANTFADGIEWSGFGSVYYSQAFDQNFLLPGYTSNKMDFTRNSLIGLNVGSKISDNLSAAAQIIAKGAGAQATNFNMYAQWANLTYSVVPSLNMKLGRQLLPVLITSEYQKVQYLLPSTEIPPAVYNAFPFISFDGLSLNKTFDLGFATLLASVYAGTPILDVTPPSTITYVGNSLLGTRFTLDGSGWRLHTNAVKNHSKLSIPAASMSAEVDTHTYTVGYRVDKHNIVSWGELIYSKGANATKLSATNKKFAEESYGWYVLAGHRIDKFLPYLAYSASSTRLGVPAQVTNQSLDGRSKTYTAGVNYQLHDQAIVKVSYNRAYVPSIQGGNWIIQGPDSTRKFGDAVSAGVDFIF